MPITLIRVINQQVVNRSILLDKLDDGQANTEGYAYLPKQQVYVPYVNPIDSNVKGYVDLIPSDRVLLSADRGTLHRLAEAWNIHGFISTGIISMFAFSSALIVTPTITSVSHIATDTTIDGTTFLSVTPDVTYVIFKNAAGITQYVPSSAFTTFTDTQIVVPDSAITIGSPAETWTVTVQANSKLSNERPLRAIAVITTAVLDAPTAGDVTITGVDFLSTLPATSSVVFTGTGAVTLTRAAILAGSGTFTNTSIVIPAALVPGVAEATTSAAVIAEGFTSAAKALIVRPVLSTGVLNNPLTGDITLTGTSFLSTAPAVSSVAITGTGAVTLTRAAIIAGSGTFTETSIVIPAALVPGVVETASSVTVTADGLASSTLALVAKPVLTSSVLNDPLTGDVTLAGINFLSTLPATSSVVFTGTGAVTLTRAAILAGSGTFTETSIVIPAALVPGVVEAATSAAVVADGLTSDAMALVAKPILSSAVIDTPGVGDLTMAGSDFLSTPPAVSSVIITGTGAVTLTRAAILAAGGVAAFTDSSIVIPASLIPGVAATTSSAQVSADSLLSAVVVVTV